MGTGSDHRSPNTVSTINGTQIQCNSSLVGFSWLAPYSPSHSLTVRITATLRPRPEFATATMRGDFAGVLFSGVC